MLNHELRQDESILVLHPDGPLEAGDFTALASDVDAHLEQQGKLRGVLIRAESFPGWKLFSALLAHLMFIKGHHRGIEKVAVVSDGAFANSMPDIAGQFVSAQVRHFNHAREYAAWDWLRQSGNAQMRPAA